MIGDYVRKARGVKDKFNIGTGTMDPQDLQRLKKELEEEKIKIEAELESFADKNPVVKGDYQARFPLTDETDTLDVKAHSVTGYEEERAIEQNLEMRLKEINETLKKIEAGTYGICVKCLAPIEEKRLMAVPAARFCFPCAKMARLI